MRCTSMLRMLCHGGLNYRYMSKLHATLHLSPSAREKVHPGIMVWLRSNQTTHADWEFMATSSCNSENDITSQQTMNINKKGVLWPRLTRIADQVVTISELRIARPRAGQALGRVTISQIATINFTFEVNSLAHSDWLSDGSCQYGIKSDQIWTKFDIPVWLPSLCFVCDVCRVIR